jgi:adenylate cyclase
MEFLLKNPGFNKKSKYNRIIRFIQKSGIFLNSFYFSLIAVLLTFLLLQVQFIGSQIDLLEQKMIDARFQFRGSTLEKNKKIDDIIILDIDEKSLNKLGQFSKWPNSYFASVVDILSQGSAAAVGFDIFFPENDSLTLDILEIYVKKISDEIDLPITKPKLEEILKHTSTDQIFAQSLANASNVYLAMFDQNIDIMVKTTKKELPKNVYKYHLTKLPKSVVQTKNPFPPIPLLADSAKRIGFAHINNDKDGVIRYYPLLFQYEDSFITNFSLQIALDLLKVEKIKYDKKKLYLLNNNNDEIIIPLDSKDRLLINFYGKKRSFRYISFCDVLSHRIPAKYFKNKIVLIGPSAYGLEDLKTVPLDQSYPGVELHATLIYNILNNQFITYPSTLLYYLSIWLFIGLSILMFNFLSPYKSVFLLILLNVAIWIFTLFLFDAVNVLFEYMPAMISLNIAFVIFIGYQYKTQIKERKRIKNTFEKYISGNLVKEVLQHPEDLKSGGKKKEVSVVYTDLADFTTMCEKNDPAVISSFLTDYLTRCTQTIIDNSGMLDKYIGDAIVAIFGVPIEIENYTLKACMAALQIQKITNQIRQDYTDNPYFANLITRVGISTGELIVGNMGSKQIFDYTGIGDLMNFGSRLEGLNKYYRTRILINENTRNSLPPEFLTRRIDTVRVKGKMIGENIYELIEHSDQKEFSETTLEKIDSFEAGLTAYQKGDFKNASQLLTKAIEIDPEDHPPQLILERITSLKKKPEKDWDGIWTMRRK